MKTVFVKLTGQPKIGDRVLITTSHRQRGGASSIQHLVRKPREEVVYLDQVQVEDPETGELRMEPDFHGRTEVRLHHETLESIIDALISNGNSLNASFHGLEVQVRKRNSNEILIQVGSTLDDNVFYGSVENLRGPGLQLEVETIG